MRTISRQPKIIMFLFCMGNISDNVKCQVVSVCMRSILSYWMSFKVYKSKAS